MSHRCNHFTRPSIVVAMSKHFPCDDVFVVSVFALIAYAAAAPKKNECQGICTADYTPVCGKPAEGKGTDITFGNQCVLNNYNCEKKDKRE